MERRREDVETSSSLSPLRFLLCRFSVLSSKRFVSNVAVAWYMLRRQSGISTAIITHALMSIVPVFI